MAKKFVSTDRATVAYQVYGSGARTLLVFHGLLGSSWIRPEWIEAIARADVRIVVAERPGYGHSSVLTMESAADWNPLLQCVMETEQITSAIAVGCSAGGVYAYAAAAAFPEIVTQVWILNGVTAVFLERVFRHYNEQACRAYRRFLTEPMIEIQKEYAERLDAVIASCNDPPDSFIAKTLADARANNCFAMAQESCLQIKPWGFDLESIRTPIILWHAEGDTMVPYGAACEMASILRNSHLMTAPADSLAAERNAYTNSIAHSDSINLGFMTLLQMLPPVQQDREDRA